MIGEITLTVVAACFCTALIAMTAAFLIVIHRMIRESRESPTCTPRR